LALHRASEQLQIRVGGCNEPSVKRDIVLGHSARREPIFESAPNLLAGQAPDPVHGRCRTRLVFDDETSHSVLDDLRNGTTIEGYDGRAACHGFNRYEPKRLRPIDRREQSDGAAEKSWLFGIADLANEF